MDNQFPLNNKIDIDVIAQNEGVCKTGVPFPISIISSIDQLVLCQNSKIVECFAQPTSYWPDGSIKWVSLSFFHSEDASKYELVISNLADLKLDIQERSTLQLNSNKNELTIATEQFEFSLNFETLALSVQLSSETKQLLKIASLAGTLFQNNNLPIVAKLDSWNSRTLKDLKDGSSGVIELKLEGYFECQSDKHPLKFTTIIEFYHSVSSIKVTTTLHNPNPAKHPEGLWDLGDDGSELFDAFTFELALAENDGVKYQTSPSSEWQSSEFKTHITQHSSGGANWQSPVHIDRNNQVVQTLNGFEITQNQIKISHAGRVTPTLHSDNGVTLTVEKFWQNFPSAIGVDGANVEIGLFPSQARYQHELQGGEKKTHTFWVSLSGKANSLNWVHTPPIAKPATAWLTRCSALPTFSALESTNPIAKLIQYGLEHEQNFFAKREAIDEYGWRNFGDLYADHETANHDGSELFISHYNNQYDPIFGFIKQFLLTSDIRWFELADDLAKHVADIDIYHTEEDKAEYNGGLFWHTDHYLKAHTSTHRSYSKLQENNAYEGRAGGGGPGGQHCYTTGLACHYLLTGTESSKLAVLTLTEWIACVYEGTDTCLELLLAVKNRDVPGLKNHLSGQYPFDRGTAHYIIALLDSYQLTQEKAHLDQVEHIIQNTVHPSDNITERDLANAEDCWFYTVFLQAICRYLEVKEISGLFDDAFYYARDVLLHYADWMLNNEQPYLETPEILEFPNDTWTAQDLRKVHVLAAAFYYSPDSNRAYLDKSHYFLQYIAKHLAVSAELSYTRILVLLMQNYGALEYYTSKQKVEDFAECRQGWAKAGYQQASSFTTALAKALGRRLSKLSIANEIIWLKKRMGK